MFGLSQTSLLIFIFLSFFDFSSTIWEDIGEEDTHQEEKVTESSAKKVDLVQMPSATQLFEEGKQQYELLHQKQPLYGPCWSEAIKQVHVGCKSLDENIQYYLALLFTNCFLEKSGLRDDLCDSSKPEYCVKRMSEKAFNVFTEFFTHTQSICFFLQNEMWQQQTHDTIGKLSETSYQVTKKLSKASRNLDELHNLQMRSINSQLLFLEELRNSRIAFEDFKRHSEEQRFIVSEILDRFIKLQNFVLAEITFGYSIAYYLLSLLIIYLLTTPNRTGAARFWLYLILISQLAYERFIAKLSSDDDILLGMNYAADALNDKIWFARKVTLLIMFLVLLWFGFTYKNFDQLNYNMLHTINNEIQELKNLSLNGKLLHFYSICSTN